MSKLTVWSMCTGGKYPIEYVHTLKRMVERNLTIPHEFICITEHEIEGVTTQKPINDLPGWWLKTTLFSATVSRYRNLWLDLDVVITGNIDCLAEPMKNSHALEGLRAGLNWAVSGHGGVQSSVMYWQTCNASEIHNAFDSNIAYWPPRNDNGKLWGDQEWITHLRDEGRLKVEYFDTSHLVSYKYHCRDGLPADARVVVFHGKPDPAEVSDDWVIKARA